MADFVLSACGSSSHSLSTDFNDSHISAISAFVADAKQEMYSLPTKTFETSETRKLSHALLNREDHL